MIPFVRTRSELEQCLDRDSEICRDLFDTMDAAVLDAIDRIIERATQAGLTTSLCGQAVPTDPDLAEHLVRRGSRESSVRVHDHDRAVGVLDEGVARRSEQQSAESAAATAADHHQLRRL